MSVHESSARSARGVYGISVASELSGLGPQTLRLYETRGLLTPARSEGGTRRYSDDDLDRLQRITELLAAGINLAGISEIFTLEARNSQLEHANARLASENARLVAWRDSR
ncbi:MerR family transcriptional regulator [Mycobacterium antarcticum]